MLRIIAVLNEGKIVTSELHRATEIKAHKDLLLLINSAETQKEKKKKET